MKVASPPIGMLYLVQAMLSASPRWRLIQRFSLLIRIFCLLGFGMACLESNAQSRTQDGYHSSDHSEALVQQVFQRINDYRKKHRLPALQWDDRITAVALAHSQDMAAGRVPPGHEGMSARMDQLKERIPAIRSMAENIVVGPPVIEELVKAWIKSEVHRKNIKGAYNATALAMATDAQGIVYLTQIFVYYPDSTKDRPLPQKR